MASVTQLGYLGIGVSDIDAWERFATETLGLQVSKDSDDGSMFLRMDEYHHRFILHPGGNDDVAYVGWQVADEHAFTELTGQLKAAGTDVIPGTQAEAEARRVVGLAKFVDPSGIPGEVYFGPPVSFDTPFKSPRPISGFETGTMGLGHIVLTVDDYDASLHFYRDVLGMHISDFVQLNLPSGFKGTMAFFHCNPRHHTLAFMTAPSPKRLRHFMVQLKSLDDVGTTYFMAQDQGAPIARGMGRHTNDHMVSFYVRSPSGFEVEYGWGAREVDNATWQVQQHTKGSIWGHRPPVVQPAQEPVTARS